MLEILDESQKSLNLVIVPWHSPFEDLRHLCRIRVDSLVVDDVTKAVHTVRVEVALLGVEGHLLLAQDVHDNL